jgi:hypothetical protein
MVMVDRGDCWQRAYVIPKGGIGGIKSEVFEALRARVVEKLPSAWASSRQAATVDEDMATPCAAAPYRYALPTSAVGSALWVISEVDILTLLFGRDRSGKRGVRQWRNGGLGRHRLSPRREYARSYCRFNDPPVC